MKQGNLEDNAPPSTHQRLFRLSCPPPSPRVPAPGRPPPRPGASGAGAAGRQLMSFSRFFREFPPPGMCRGRPLRRCAPTNAPTAPAVRCCRSAPSSETLPRFPTPAPLRRHLPASGGGGCPPCDFFPGLSPKSAKSGYCSASATDNIHRQKE